MKFTVEFHRVTYEKAFLEIEADVILAADKIAKKVSADDQRLEFEPMSSVMGVHNIKSEMPP